jgi:hypothetical protein
MGSQLRKLRAKAGTAGIAHQRSLRQKSQARARAERLAVMPKVGLVPPPNSAAAMERALDRLTAEAREARDRHQGACIPVELAEQVYAATEHWPEGGGLHVAQFLTLEEQVRSGLGDVCRKCGRARSESIAVDATGTSAAAALASLRGVNPPARFYEPASIELSIGGKPLAEEAIAPAEPGFRKRIRPMPLLALAAMFGALADVPPGRGSR